jgi:hypothetical protein
MRAGRKNLCIPDTEKAELRPGNARRNPGQNTNIFEGEELQRPEALKFLIFFKKIAKKCLTFPFCFVILLKLACGKP